MTETLTSYTVSDIFEAMESSMSLDAVLDRVLAVALREVDGDEGSVLLLDGPDSTTLRMAAGRGLPPEVQARGYVQRRGTVSGYVVTSRQPVIVNAGDEPGHYLPMETELSLPVRIRSALCVPLVARNRVLGTMSVNRVDVAKPDFKHMDLEKVSVLAGQAAVIIDNRMLQEELASRERLAVVGQTVATITHCVKNILTGVRGGVGVARMGLEQGNPKLTETGIETLSRNASMLSNLLMDLLDYSKERRPVRTRFPVGRMVDQVVDTLRFKAEAAEVELKATVPPGLEYEGDEDQIMRALMNLVTNAIEAFCDPDRPARGERRVELSARVSDHPDPRMTPVTARPGDRWLVLEVADTGPGIAAEAQGQIWDMFYSTKGSRGTGIGLTVTRKMIEEHRGRILFETHEGQGTVFRILLPMGGAAPASAGA